MSPDTESISPGTCWCRTSQFFYLDIENFVLIATHLKGSNGAECVVDGASHVVDFKTLQGLFHYNNTSIIPGATLEKRQSSVNNEHRKRAKDLGADLHGTTPAQRRIRLW